MIEERMRALTTLTRVSGAEKAEIRFEDLEKHVDDDMNPEDEEWEMDEEIDYDSDDEVQRAVGAKSSKFKRQGLASQGIFYGHSSVL